MQVSRLLRRSISLSLRAANACQALQKDWLKKQHAIMEEQTSADRIKTSLGEIKNRKTIMESKRVRLEGDLTIQQKEIKQLDVAVKTLKMEMDRMNAQIAKYEKDAHSLHNENEVQEKEFIAKLKVLVHANGAYPPSSVGELKR